MGTTLNTIKNRIRTLEEQPLLDSKPEVQLPQNDKTIHQFSKELAKAFKNNNDIFYKPSEGDIVEITDHYDVLLKQDIISLKVVEPKKLINIIENKVNTYIEVETKFSGIKKIFKSPSEQIIKVVAVNDDFTNSLYKLNRFLNYPMPFLTSKNELIIPEIGYDERFQAYFTKDTPEIKEITRQEAKKIINDILSEFCFKEPIDKIMAIAYLLTPACRGLYKRATNRTPLFIIKANRERAGKDYLAGVIGILYEGRAIDDPPFCVGGLDGNNNDELRKKFTSAIKQGRRRIHSSNNRGNLTNAVLEQFITSETWRDRELGRNKELELNNEIDISLSANVGITYTPDLWHRARPINLSYFEEDPNNRVFKQSDLWGYVKTNRGLILSAIYTLIKEWVEGGQISDNIAFTSFPEWARVVGGIMTYHDLGNPCTKVEDDGIGGDQETSDMKKLFTLLSNKQISTLIKEFTVSDMKNIIMTSDTFDGFNNWNLEEKKYQIRLGLLIKRFVGREFKCLLNNEDFNVKLVVKNDNNRANRQTYEFVITKIESGNVGNVGNVSQSVLSDREILKNILGMESIPNITTLPEIDKFLDEEIVYDEDILN